MRISTWVAALVLALVALVVVAEPFGTVDPAAGPPTRPTEKPSPSAPAARRSVTVLMTGDVLIHNGVWESAQALGAARGLDAPYFRPMFRSVKPAVSRADLAICHLETPVSEPDGPYEQYPLFAAPPQVIDGLEAAGFDACTTASNHAVDQGFTGLVRTAKALDRAGIAHTGTAVTRAASRRPLILEAAGVRIGLLSATYSTNGMYVEHDWSVNLIDVPTLRRQARELREAGAEVVMVALHAGTEYDHEPNEQQREVVDALTASPDIDFVYGHHAHVVQPWAKVNGTWVAYGLGNFIAQQSTDRPSTYRGQAAEITFVERPDGSFRAVRPGSRALFIVNPYEPGGAAVLDARAALRDPSTPEVLLPQLRAAVQEIRDLVLVPGVRLLGGP